MYPRRGVKFFERKTQLKESDLPNFFCVIQAAERKKRQQKNLQGILF
jgi:hypothetical protein